MSSNIIGFGWEIRKLAFWKLSILDYICCSASHDLWHHPKEKETSQYKNHWIKLICRNFIDMVIAAPSASRDRILVRTHTSFWKPLRLYAKTLVSDFVFVYFYVESKAHCFGNVDNKFFLQSAYILCLWPFTKTWTFCQKYMPYIPHAYNW